MNRYYWTCTREKIKMDRDMIVKLVGIASSWYQQSDIHIEHDETFDTVIVEKHNTVATFIGDEFDKYLACKVLNHVIGIDDDDKEGDIFHVILPEYLDYTNVGEKIIMRDNAVKLTAIIYVNDMDIELYTISVMDDFRRFKYRDVVKDDNISESDTWTIPEFKCEIPDLVAGRLLTMSNFTSNVFKNIEFLNGDPTEVNSCIEYAEKEGGKLFCSVDIENKSCVFGVNHYNESKGTYEPCWEFHSKW